MKKKETDKEAALELYFKDWSLAKIAKVLNLSESTIIRWKKKHNWEQTKLDQSSLMRDSTHSIWTLINYQNKALNARIKEYEKAAEDGKGYKVIERGDLDALQKLYSIVKKNDTDTITIIEISTELLEHVQSKDFKLAQKLEQHVTEFINIKRGQ